MIKYVTYRRVSTQEQGKSGLGLDAQQRDIELYLENYSSQPAEVVGEFVDVLSGTDNNRPELNKAIALAKKEKAILLVAKLDRLSRSVSFIASVMEDRALQFKVAQMPHADKFQLHIYAALAEQERDFISKRTKAALAVAKARGVKLGGLRDKTNARNKAKIVEADAFAAKLWPIIKPMHESGLGLSEIARRLNQSGTMTARGKEFAPVTVSNLIARCAGVA